MDAELGVDVAQVGLEGVVGEEQLALDGRALMALGDEIDNPSFLGYEGTVTVTCRDYHDKILDRTTNRVSCLIGGSWDGYSVQYPHFDSWGLLYGAKQWSGNQFAFSEDKVWTTPAKVEVTIE